MATLCSFKPLTSKDLRDVDATPRKTPVDTSTRDSVASSHLTDEAAELVVLEKLKALQRRSAHNAKDRSKLVAFKELLQCQTLQNIQPRKPSTSTAATDPQQFTASRRSSLRQTVLLNAADVCSTCGHGQAALDYYLEALRISADDAILWQRAIRCAMRDAKDLKVAKALALEVRELFPTDRVILQQLVDLLFVSLDLTECLVALDDLVELDSNVNLKASVLRNEVIARLQGAGAERPMRVGRYELVMQRMNELRNDLASTSNDDEEITRIPLELKSKPRDWQGLGEAILTHYNNNIERLHLPISTQLSYDPLLATPLQSPQASSSAHSLSSTAQADAVVIASPEHVVMRRSNRLMPDAYRISDASASALDESDASADSPLQDRIEQYVPSDLLMLPPDEDIVTTTVAAMDVADVDVDVENLTSNMVGSVEAFLEELDGCSTIEVVFRFLAKLAPFYKLRWPSQLSSVFRRLGLCYFHHSAHLHNGIPLNDLPEGSRPPFLHNVLLALVCVADYSTEDVESCAATERCLRILEENLNLFPETVPEVECTIQWLSALFLLNSNRLIECKEKLVELADSEFIKTERVIVPNLLVSTSRIVDSSTVRAKLDQLERRMQLGLVHQLFSAGQTDAVLEILSYNLIKNGQKEKVSTENCTHVMLLITCLLERELLSEALVWISEILCSATIKECTHELQSCFVNALNIFDTLYTDFARFLFDDGRPSSVCRQMAASMIAIIVQTAETSPNAVLLVLPWKCLYRLCRDYELSHFSQDYARWWFGRATGNRVVLATRGLMLLRLAHEILGDRHLCTTGAGRLLLFYSSEVYVILKHPKIVPYMPERCSDDMLNEAEQCFYCLYQYGTRRKRHLEDHKTSTIALKWGSPVRVLFEFFKPADLPEFDDLKTNTSTITAETEQLLKKIEHTIPEELRPDAVLPLLEDHLSGHIPNLPSFPTVSNCVVEDLYYLLADYYLKFRDTEPALATRYYMLDICVNPARVDSWGGLALNLSSNVLKDMGSADGDLSEPTFRRHLREGHRVVRIFQHAVRLAERHQVLLLEYAAFVYQLHSLCVRFGGEVEGASPTALHLASCQADRQLRSALRLYKRAQSIADTDEDPGERWLVCYMRGKIAEKLRLPARNALSCYTLGLLYSHVEGAKYPLKIRYQAPQKGSLEALELYYRCYAVMTKRVLDAADEPLTVEEVAVFQQYMERLQNSPLVLKETQKESRLEPDSFWTLDPDAVACVGDVVDKVTRTAGVERHVIDGSIIDDLLDRCMLAFALCARRFPAEYKALYWIARIFYHRKKFDRARDVLFGPLPSDIDMGQTSLFRPSNLFSALFRLPASDIDRAGSFSMHLVRSLRLALRVLRACGDAAQMVNVAVQLARKPDSDKRYILEEQRSHFWQRALAMSLVVVRRRVQTVFTVGYETQAQQLHAVRCLLVDLHSNYLTLQRVPSSSIEEQFRAAIAEYENMLRAVYRFLVPSAAPLHTADALQLPMKTVSTLAQQISAVLKPVNKKAKQQSSSASVQQQQQQATSNNDSDKENQMHRSHSNQSISTLMSPDRSAAQISTRRFTDDDDTRRTAASASLGEAAREGEEVVSNAVARDEADVSHASHVQNSSTVDEPSSHDAEPLTSTELEHHANLTRMPHVQSNLSEDQQSAQDNEVVKLDSAREVSRTEGEVQSITDVQTASVVEMDDCKSDVVIDKAIRRTRSVEDSDGRDNEFAKHSASGQAELDTGTTSLLSDVPENSRDDAKTSFLALKSKYKRKRHVITQMDLLIARKRVKRAARTLRGLPSRR